jgi:hypothetical protein
MPNTDFPFGYNLPAKTPGFSDYRNSGKCGKPAKPFVPRWGMSFACVLDKDHDGPCRPGGTCFKHGPYVGDQCPQWPECVKLNENKEFDYE